MIKFGKPANSKKNTKSVFSSCLFFYFVIIWLCFLIKTKFWQINSTLNHIIFFVVKVFLFPRSPKTPFSLSCFISFFRPFSLTDLCIMRKFYAFQSLSALITLKNVYQSNQKPSQAKFSPINGIIEFNSNCLTVGNWMYLAYLFFCARY